MKFSVDDQMRVNRGLDSMGVQWRQLNDKSYQGITGGKIPLKDNDTAIIGDLSSLW